ncbi:uncharacterized protein LOC120692355 isoform X2 [Panicum virgatum]|uniref:uncharacterized protein LOC120692355 isoform X2 n=1 Tax=Panicum virgatum TaxID=38727 RepID=UPI0019D6205A|nr:uncharacterized protein LOC120692355 isoform X2 [Panicum virgatum]
MSTPQQLSFVVPQASVAPALLTTDDAELKPLPGATTTSTTKRAEPEIDADANAASWGNNAEAEQQAHRGRCTASLRHLTTPRFVPCLAWTFDEPFDEETFVTAPDAERDAELILENMNDQQEFEEEPSQFSSLPKDAGFRRWFFLGLTPSQLPVEML